MARGNSRPAAGKLRSRIRARNYVEIQVVVGVGLETLFASTPNMRCGLARGLLEDAVALDRRAPAVDGEGTLFVVLRVLVGALLDAEGLVDAK